MRMSMCHSNTEHEPTDDDVWNPVEARPAQPSKPTPEELEKLLSLLDESYGMQRRPAHCAQERCLAPEAKREIVSERLATVADYMNDLLEKYASQPAGQNAPASQPALSEGSQTQPTPPPRAEGADVPTPAGPSDGESTRSQLEQLRQISIVTAKNAIRRSRSRRRRQAVLRWRVLAWVVLGILLLRQLVLGY